MSKKSSAWWDVLAGAALVGGAVGLACKYPEAFADGLAERERERERERREARCRQLAEDLVEAYTGGSDYSVCTKVRMLREERAEFSRRLRQAERDDDYFAVVRARRAIRELDAKIDRLL